MIVWYDNEKYLPHCMCGAVGTLEEVRRVVYSKYLKLTDDGMVEEDGEDGDEFEDGYRCNKCWNTADNLEDLLALRPTSHFCSDCDDLLPEELRDPKDEDGEDVEPFCQDCLGERQAEYKIGLIEWERGY